MLGCCKRLGAGAHRDRSAAPAPSPSTRKNSRRVREKLTTNLTSNGVAEREEQGVGPRRPIRAAWRILTHRWLSGGRRSRSGGGGLHLRARINIIGGWVRRDKPAWRSG